MTYGGGPSVNQLCNLFFPSKTIFGNLIGF